MSDYRIEAASKEEWAERALQAEAKLALRTGEADAKTTIIKELEAKLAKAVEALEVLSDYKNLDTPCGYYDGGCIIFSDHARQRYGDFDDLARTTLAELKGDAK